jgi:hypothetical protein
VKCRPDWEVKQFFDDESVVALFRHRDASAACDKQRRLFIHVATLIEKGHPGVTPLPRDS